jgi:hypothetical protein
MNFNSILGRDAKKYQQAFLVPLPGMNFNSILGSDAKNANKHFWRHCRG